MPIESQIIEKNLQHESVTELFEYSNNLLTYYGKANPGASTSDASWNIKKFTYIGSSLVQSQIAFGAWDDKEILVYS